MFLDSAARRLRRFFARKHRKHRCENKTQVQFRVSKVPKLELQHMPAKKSHHFHAAADARAASNNNGNDDSNSNNYNNLKDPPRWVPAKANDTTDALH